MMENDANMEPKIFAKSRYICQKYMQEDILNMAPNQDTCRIHGGEVGGPFNTDNTKPTVLDTESN